MGPPRQGMGVVGLGGVAKSMQNALISSLGETLMRAKGVPWVVDPGEELWGDAFRLPLDPTS